MGNIPLNTQYSNLIKKSILPLGKLTSIVNSQASAPKPGIFNYIPRTTYTNLTNTFRPTTNAFPGTPEYEQAKNLSLYQYGNLINEGKGIQTGKQFMPVQGDLNAPIPIPADYDNFAKPASFNQDGQKLSWGTPVSPVIRNISVGDTTAQYVQDTANKDLLVKTGTTNESGQIIRKRNDMRDDAILSGRIGSLYQIDHILPLSLGGADTEENRQLFTNNQHVEKTIAQSIPYTLYAYGDISLSEARIMALQWKGHDLSDIPEPNDVGLVANTNGKTGIEIAREAKQRWNQPKPVTFKEVMAGIPEAAKDLGKGWMPDPIREFVKGFASQGTMGFIPYEQGEDQSGLSWLGGKVGQITGALASFMLGGAVLRGAMGITKLGKLASGAYNSLRGLTSTKLAKAGLGLPKGTMGPTGVGQWALPGAVETAAKGAKITFKDFNFNKVPGYIQQALNDKANLKRIAQMGATASLVGQGSQFVQNKFNPLILSDQTYQTEQENAIGNIIKDFGLGVAYSLGTPTIKGTAYATALPITLGLWANPDDPLSAITDGVVFGAMHLKGSYKNPQFNDLKTFGGKKYESPIMQEYNNQLNNFAYKTISNYSKDTLPPMIPGKTLPRETVQTAVYQGIDSLTDSFFFGKKVAPEMVAGVKADLKKYSETLNKGVDELGAPVKLSRFEKLSSLFGNKKLKEASTRDKEQFKYLENLYGKDYAEREAGKTTVRLPEEMEMDLRSLFTEAKRLTISGRQLYKGNLTTELRERADINDIMSVNDSMVKKRFEEFEKIINPPEAKATVAELTKINPKFMTESFSNEPVEIFNPASKTPGGTVAITGGAVGINKQKVQSLFDANGNKLPEVSPNLIGVDRSDLYWLWNMRNKKLTEKQIKDGDYKIDPHPENSIQVFAIKENTKTKELELIDVGWVASPFRLNESKKSINTQQKREDWGMKDIEIDKDALAPKLRSEGAPIILMNMDVVTTGKTILSQNPFIVGNLKQGNWVASKAVGTEIYNQNLSSLKKDEMIFNLNPEKYKNDPEFIRRMGEKTFSSASERISEIPLLLEELTTTNPNYKSKVRTIKEDAEGTMSKLEESLNTDSVILLKENFKKNLGIELTNEQAAPIFEKRKTLTMKDGKDLLIKSYNENGGNLETALRAEAVNTFFNSGIIEASPKGMVSLYQPLLGKGKQARPTTGIEDQFVTPKTQTELPGMKEKIINPLKTASDDMYVRAKKIIEETEPKGGGVYEPINPVTGEYEPGRGDAIIVAKKLIDSVRSIKSHKVKEIDLKTIKEELEPTLMQDISLRLRDIFDMPLEDAQAVVDKVLGTRFKNPGKFDTISQKFVQGEIDPNGDFDAVGNKFNFKPIVKKVFEKDPNFLIKNPLTNISGYDVLKNRRDAAAEGLVKWVKTGIEKAKPGTYEHARSFTLDKELASRFGKDYATNPKTRQLLGRSFGTEGSVAKRWKNLSETLDTTKNMEPFTQSKDYLNALATGNRGAKAFAEANRLRNLKENPTEYGEISSQTKQDLLSAKLGPEEMSAGGIRIVNPRQEQDMIKDMARGDFQFLPGLSSIEIAGAESTGPGGVRRGVEDARNILQFIIKSNNDAVAAGKSGQFMTLTPDKGYTGLWKNLSEKQVKEVNKKTDNYFNDIFKGYMKRLKVQEKKKGKLTEVATKIPDLKKKLKSIEEAIANPEERANWQTPELLQDNLKTIKKNLERALRIMKETQGGQGGPGYHDGRGGFLNDAWGSLKNTLGGVANSAKSLAGNTVGVITDTWKNLSKPKEVVMDFKIEKPKIEMIEVTKDNPNPNPVYNPKKIIKEESPFKTPLSPKSRITVFNPLEEQTDSTPNTGGMIRKMEFGDIALANRNEYDPIKEKYSNNKEDTFVYVPELKDIKTPHGNGIFRVNDTMNIEEGTTNNMDVFIPLNMMGGKEEQSVRNLEKTGASYQFIDNPNNQVAVNPKSDYMGTGSMVSSMYAQTTYPNIDKMLQWKRLAGAFKSFDKFGNDKIDQPVIDVLAEKKLKNNLPLTDSARKLLDEKVIFDVTGLSGEFTGSGGDYREAFKDNARYDSSGKEIPDSGTQSLETGKGNYGYARIHQYPATGELTTTHEALHALLMETGKSRSPLFFNEFLKTWYSNRSNEDMVNIEEHMKRSGIYKDNFKPGNEDILANEFFAYLGAQYGNDGLNAIPASFRKFYTDIFKKK